MSTSYYVRHRNQDELINRFAMDYSQFIKSDYLKEYIIGSGLLEVKICRMSYGHEAKFIPSNCFSNLNELKFFLYKSNTEFCIFDEYDRELSFDDFKRKLEEHNRIYRKMFIEKVKEIIKDKHK